MAEHGFWHTLSSSGQADLTAAGRVEVFAAGSVVIAHHDESGDVSVIRSGMVKAVVTTADGHQVVLALRGKDDIVGELGNAAGGPRSATVVAVTQVEALAVPGRVFTSFLKYHPEAAEALHRTVVSRLVEADRDRLAAASMTVGQRLARLLLKIADRYGVPGPNGSLRTEQLSQEELAACIGGATRTVAREIALWRKRNIISTERRSITLHDPAALERIAGRHAPPP